MISYPKEVEIGVEEFLRSGWESALEGNGREHNLWGISQSLSSAAQIAMEGGKSAEGKVLWLLADACSMILDPKSINEPFKPFMVIQGKRSAVPEDFAEEDITFFSQIAEKIDDAWLKARIADLVWLLSRPRNHRFALLAIDAYRMIPLESKTWKQGGQQCCERAVNLTLMLGKGAGTRAKEIEAELLDTFLKATSEDSFLSLNIAELMLQKGFGRGKELDIAKKLEELAMHLDSEAIFFIARAYFELAAKWFLKAGEKASVTRMIVYEAETWVKDAHARISSDNPSNMVAARFFENAIQKYRSVPRAEREHHRLDERIAELYAEMSSAGEKSLTEMGVISSGQIDITEIIEASGNAVRGKNAYEALMAFANIYKGCRVSQIREFSQKMLHEHPMQAIISATLMSRDGRVIAKRPGMNLGNSAAEENEEVIWAEMVKHYIMELSLIVQGFIWPALEILHLEHRLREADFISIANLSPFVPQGRDRLFGKALFAGYERDFVVALHTLIPQIENMVRSHLKSRDVKTTVLDSNGIENEIGLSSLMELPETKDVLGEDLTFEFRALFCDAFGPNLRNELAHGLLDNEAFESINAIYAWWLTLKIVFNTFLNSQSVQSEKPTEENDSPPDEVEAEPQRA